MKKILLSLGFVGIFTVPVVSCSSNSSSGETIKMNKYASEAVKVIRS